MTPLYPRQAPADNWGRREGGRPGNGWKRIREKPVHPRLGQRLPGRKTQRPPGAERADDTLVKANGEKPAPADLAARKPIVERLGAKLSDLRAAREEAARKSLDKIARRGLAQCEDMEAAAGIAAVRRLGASAAMPPRAQASGRSMNEHATER